MKISVMRDYEVNLYNEDLFIYLFKVIDNDNYFNIDIQKTYIEDDDIVLNLLSFERVQEKTIIKYTVQDVKTDEEYYQKIHTFEIYFEDDSIVVDHFKEDY